MKEKPKKRKELTPEEKEKRVQELVEIGIRIMPMFQAKPNPNKK